MDETLEETNSENSSLNDFSVLDQDQYEEIKQATPAVYFNRLNQVVLETASDKEDDFSEYPFEAETGEEIELATDDFPVLAKNLKSQSSQSGHDTGSLTQEVNKNWKSVFSGSIKEELRYKIQLNRLNTGQEELKVDFTEPEPTVCFEAVKKRNQIREKNKEYARESRNRVKLERQLLEKKNESLQDKNLKLHRKIAALRDKLEKTRTLFDRHHESCPICSSDEETVLCALNKDAPNKLLGSGASSSFDPQPGPSGVSTVKDVNTKSDTKRIFFWKTKNRSNKIYFEPKTS